MEKLWHVQKLKDGTYGNWREFKENKGGGKMRTFIVRDSRSGKDRKVKGSDIPMPNVMLRVGDYINSEEFIVEIIEKEVKKMKYFELKVVKVKKEKKDFWCGGMKIDGKQYKVFKRKKGIPYLKEFDKGNWVNGENLDKIKFPCFCSWDIPFDKDREHGILVKGDGDIYNLYDIRGQHSYSRLVEANKNLKELIKRWNIHILKGKIIIYDDDMEDKYSDD